VSKVQRILQENSKTIETMVLQDHNCAQITAMWLIISANVIFSQLKMVSFSPDWHFLRFYLNGFMNTQNRLCNTKIPFIHMTWTITSWCEVGAWYAGLQGLWVPFYAEKINSQKYVQQTLQLYL